jgi:hypothetical protein
MNNYTDKLEDALDELLSKQSWGYEFEMSDYATSKEAEQRYEKEGLAEINELKQAILSLINRDYILKSEVLSALEEEYGTDNYKPFLVATKSIPLEKNIHAAKIVLIARNQLRAELKTKLGLEK